MLILFLALIFGVVVLILLLRSMHGRFKAQLHGRGIEKVRAIIKLILLIVVIAYILVYVVVIMKTIFL